MEAFLLARNAFLLTQSDAFSGVKTSNIIFVTGTDTGVGKTFLTAMLVRYLRQKGVHALAIKPFCSGSLRDARILQKAQDDELRLDEINWYFFSKPVAPLAAVKDIAKLPSLGQVVGRIEKVARSCEVLLVEGAGGLMVPLGRRYLILDLIARLQCRILLVGKNKLGTINHSLLSVAAIRLKKLERRIDVVLMDQKAPDSSARSNASILKRLVSETSIISAPYCAEQRGSENKLRKMEKTLAQLVDRTYFPRSLRSGDRRKNRKFEKIRDDR